MRRFASALLLALLVLYGSAAQAGPISAGDSVVLSDSFGTTGGGEFLMTVVGDPLNAFLTFCLQRTEFISFGQEYTVQAVSTFTDDTPIDHLDSRTAWLYTQFRAGTLSGYMYETATAAQRLAHTETANLLQLAIWGLEGELSLNELNPFVQLATLYTPVDFGFGNVRVLNLYRNGVKAQDQLALIQPVPEPATLLLFGSGLAVAAYRSRRKRQPQVPIA